MIEIPLPPLQSVTFLKYYDENNAQQTLVNTRYQVDTVSEPARLIIDTAGWPNIYSRANAVTVEFVCGYGVAGSDVPASLRAAMLLHIGDLFENRQNGQAQEVYQNPAYDSLTYPYRVLSA